MLSGILACAGSAAPPAVAPSAGNRFALSDVFLLEWADNPRISPDGKLVVFERWHFDIKTDERRVALWSVRADGSGMAALAAGEQAFSPLWSRDGTHLLYAQSVESQVQFFSRDVRSGRITQVTHVRAGIRSPAWSPGDTAIAFLMFVSESAKSIAHLPSKPPGADWGPPL